MKQPAIYILANKRNGTLYIGVTGDLHTRSYQHHEGKGAAFPSKYGCTMLVYYELFSSISEAIAREKQLKAGSRKKKLILVESMNPEWKDLYSSLF